MPEKVYLYDYPEQRVMAKSLAPKDNHIIAKLTGRSVDMINKIFNGTRRITSDVIEVYEIVVKANNAKRKILKNNPVQNQLNVP